MDTIPLNELNMNGEEFNSLKKKARSEAEALMEEKAGDEEEVDFDIASPSDASVRQIQTQEEIASRYQDVYIGDDFLDITVPKTEEYPDGFRTLEDGEYTINSIRIQLYQASQMEMGMQLSQINIVSISSLAGIRTIRIFLRQ